MCNPKSLVLEYCSQDIKFAVSKCSSSYESLRVVSLGFHAKITSNNNKSSKKQELKGSFFATSVLYEHICTILYACIHESLNFQDQTVTSNFRIIKGPLDQLAASLVVQSVCVCD